ncbi:MAG: lipopolysaccharide biosynthesis protein [Pyrinomonadaceae bacterium]
MRETAAQTEAGRLLLGGTLRLFLAEALIVPAGLVLAAYLTRRLSPAGYGLFVLSAVAVAWVQWGVTSVFARASVKLVAEADDWRAVGATVLHLYLGAGVVACVLLWISAGPVAALLGAPELAGYLRLFALDVPIFCAAHAHRHVLVGRGDFRSQSLASAGRWLGRLLLVVVFVELGLSVTGAILGSVGATVVELLVSRAFLKLPWRHPARMPARRLWGYALPLFFFVLSLRLFDKLDLFALKALSGTVEDAGFYGAAQNLSILPGLFALSFSPLLISALARAGDPQLGRTLARDALRFAVLLVPLGALFAGASWEIVRRSTARPLPRRR